ncbi:recombinase family protein [Pandoraea horticolens]|uniref:recombinase family protein n=1 Tax=Pandoraea horticolens TaxID=2508298 RepID=UPI001C2D99A0|nr:recombinase family protein [Pandoraea horticolens]
MKALRAAGCEKLFQEQVSSIGERIPLAAALEYVRESDVLVVTKLDRLARSVADLIATMQPLDRKNMGLRVLNLGEATVYRILAAAKATESG